MRPAIARLAASSRDLATAVEGGVPVGEFLKARTAFPPLLAWLLAGGPRGEDLAASLRQMAGRYRASAQFHSELLRRLLPTALLFGIGVTATLLYALTVFIPLTELCAGFRGRHLESELYSQIF